jgi:hypothetical protein
MNKKNLLTVKNAKVWRKGDQALKNSPVGYFSAGARLRRWPFAKEAKQQMTINGAQQMTIE